MIVDTSALIAVLRSEAKHEELLDAMVAGRGDIPAPVLVEFHRVASRDIANATALIRKLLNANLSVRAFSADAAAAAEEANPIFGTGNGRGGTLNLLDLMVYGAAKVAELPILCTGRDFAATDAAIHPASRLD